MDAIKEFMDAIKEAQNLAVKENIQANAIIINEKYVKVAPWAMQQATGGLNLMPPMICGLDMHFTIDELPDNYSFAILEKPKRVDESNKTQSIISELEDILRFVRGQLMITTADSTELDNIEAKGCNDVVRDISDKIAGRIQFLKGDK